MIDEKSDELRFDGALKMSVIVSTHSLLQRSETAMKIKWVADD